MGVRPMRPPPHLSRVLQWNLHELMMENLKQNHGCGPMSPHEPDSLQTISIISLTPPLILSQSCGLRGAQHTCTCTTGIMCSSKISLIHKGLGS